MSKGYNPIRYCAECGEIIYVGDYCKDCQKVLKVPSPYKKKNKDSKKSKEKREFE